MVVALFLEQSQSMSVKSTIIKVIFTVCILAQVGCSRSERSIFDESESLLNQRKFSEAIQLLENEIVNHPSLKLKTQLGYAYLGKSGVEILAVAQNIIYLKSIKLDEVESQSSMNQECPHLPDALNIHRIPCLPLFKFDGFPDSQNPYLIKALSIFKEIYPDPANTSQEINLLLAEVNLGIAASNYGHLLNDQQEIKNKNTLINRDLEIAEVSLTLKYFKRTMDSFFIGIKHLFYSYGKIKRFLDKFNGKSLVKIGNYTYYGSEYTSFDDFFNFLMSSAQKEFYQEADSSAPVKTLSSLSQTISQGLYWLRLKIDNGSENFLSDFYLHSLRFSSHIFPKRLGFSSNLNFNGGLFSQKYILPKSIQRLIDSLKKSWKEEDAKFLYDEIDQIHDEFNELEKLTLEWDRFWYQLDSKEQLALKDSADHFLNRIPVINVDPTQNIEVTGLQKWNQQSMTELNAWAQYMISVAPQNRSINQLPYLINRTENWINDNLW